MVLVAVDDHAVVDHGAGTGASADGAGEVDDGTMAALGRDAFAGR